tara:strand:- start:95202 stop:95345 length:144 start_codon:yes stop_codon:yes gene_type:complete
MPGIGAATGNIKIPVALPTISSAFLNSFETNSSVVSIVSISVDEWLV